MNADAGDDPHPSSAKAQLARHGLSPKRSLGQNFLADAGLCNKIAAVACPVLQGNVLEIGAGMGALTAPLLARCNKVVAVETDPDLSRVLEERFAAQRETGQLTLLKADVRELDLPALLGAMERPRTLAGNLPYNLSGLLLRRAVDAGSSVERCVFLLQLEVVERLCAAPDTASYGALSVFAQAVYAPKRAFIVKRGAFYPQPGVDSAVVSLEPLPSAAPLSEEFSLFVRAAFEKRRKTLRNAWRGVLGLTPVQLELVASESNVDLGARGETLGVADFQRVAERARGLSGRAR